MLLNIPFVILSDFIHVCFITVKILLDHGADVNKKDVLGNTPLHLGLCLLSVLNKKYIHESDCFVFAANVILALFGIGIIERIASVQERQLFLKHYLTALISSILFQKHHLVVIYNKRATAEAR